MLSWFLRRRFDAFERQFDFAFGMTTSRIYPTIKYALGHGKTCQRVLVGGKAVPKGGIFSERAQPGLLAPAKSVAS